MSHLKTNPMDITKEFEGLLSLQANYGKSLEALSDSMRPILEIGGVEAIESLPNEQREQLLHAALAALSEAQKRTNEIRHQIRKIMNPSGW